MKRKHGKSLRRALASDVAETSLKLRAIEAALHIFMSYATRPAAQANLAEAQLLTPL